MPVALRPQHGNQVDAGNQAVMFVRPVAHRQLHLLRIGLVQGRVVYDQDALGQADLAAGFTPQRLSGWLKSVQQARKSILGWGLLLNAVHACGFRGADRARRGYKKVDVVRVCDFGGFIPLF